MSKAKVLVGGGTGFVGTALCHALRSVGYEVKIISRQPGPSHMTWTDLQRFGLPSETVAVVNTAGQNVFDIRRRWTPGFKQNVWSSRVNTTRDIAKAIENAKESEKPKVFVSMSGVGYYKPDDKIEYTEDSSGGNFDFLSNLVTDWEKATELPTSKNVRKVILRSGVVLGREGGVISQMYWPFWLGGGGPVGSGNQYFPWIHLHDLVGFIIYSIQTPSISGIYNAVAPQVIRNKEFSSALGRAMWRPSFFPLPSAILNIAFSEERAKIMTEGQKVIPQRILQSGFNYEYKDIDSACKQCARMIYSDDQIIKKN